VKTLAFGIAFAAACYWGPGEGPAKVRGLLWFCMVGCAIFEKPVRIEFNNEIKNGKESE
jgi:hypothetical protein